MIVDTSALIAIAQGEPERDRFVAVLADSSARMSATTYVECGIVLDSRSAIRESWLDDFVQAAGIEIVPLCVEQARVARSLHRQFGRGNHPAKLNLGDCFSLALAEVRQEPLLYKGDDFALAGRPRL